MREFARYRLVRTIGAGGMAQVAEAVAQGEAGFERRVALKWVLPEMADDPAMRRMFLDEARIASRLHHANVVQVLDYGLMDGTEFIVAEFVDGMDLQRARTLSQGEIPEAVVLHVVAEVAHGLNHAHAAVDAAGRSLGIVHRDVSPGNVLLSRDGDVKLSDFGIAFSTNREERTETGLIKGKASYMAPEQARGESVTGAADVFALGVMAHALLTGAPASRYGQRRDDVPEVRAKDIRELVERCLDPAPEERPSAKAVAEVCERLRVARSQDSGRRALRDFLAPLLSQRAQPRGIDALAGFVVTQTGKGPTREFSLTPAGDTPTQAATPRAKDAATPSERPPPAAPSNRSRSFAIAFGLLFVAASAALAWPRAETNPVSETNPVASDAEGVAPTHTSTEPTVSGGAGVANTAAQPATPSSADTFSAEAQNAAPRSGADGDAPRDEPPSPPLRTSGRARPPSSRQSDRAVPPPLPEVAPDVIRDVQVVGADVFGQRVEIDDRPRGYAPTRRLSLPLGPHRLLVQDRTSGEVVVDRRFVLTEDSPALTRLP